MIKTARILLGPADEPDKNMPDVARDLLALAGLTLADITLESEDYARRTHFGNWVLVPVRDVPALAKLPPMPGGGERVDLRRSIIEAGDIEALQIGQRVTLFHDTEFGGWRQDEGKILGKKFLTIYNTLVPVVSILAKGKRKLGWQVRAGDFAEIVPLHGGEHVQSPLPISA